MSSLRFRQRIVSVDQVISQAICKLQGFDPSERHMNKQSLAEMTCRVWEIPGLECIVHIHSHDQYRRVSRAAFHPVPGVEISTSEPYLDWFNTKT